MIYPKNFTDSEICLVERVKTLHPKLSCITSDMTVSFTNQGLPAVIKFALTITNCGVTFIRINHFTKAYTTNQHINHILSHLNMIEELNKELWPTHD